MAHCTELLRAHVRAGADEALGDLRRLVSIPGSAWAGADPRHLEHSAALVAELFEDAGFPEVGIVRAAKPDGMPGAPAVLAHRPAAAGCPTVLLYAHHDVQPTGDLAAWHSPPFEAVERRGRLFGRGVSDNKGGVVLHLAACRALVRALGEEAGLVGWDEGRMELSEEDYRLDAGVLPGVQLAGSGSIASRLWTKPALSVIGIDAPPVALSADAIVPSARARFSLRLAPGDDPARALAAVRAHLEAHVPLGARITVTAGAATRAFAGDAASGPAQSMLQAMEEAWGVDPVLMGVGGSIPAAAELAARYPSAQVLITGVEDPDSRAHGADESIDLDDFHRAVLAEALLLASFGTRGGRAA